jgi:hypothetical protein
VLCAPPRIARRASSAVAVLALLLGIIAVGAPLGDVGGPIAAADAVADAGSSLDAREVLGWATSAALAAALLGAAALVDRRVP